MKTKKENLLNKSRFKKKRKSLKKKMKAQMYSSTLMTTIRPRRPLQLTKSVHTSRLMTRTLWRTLRKNNTLNNT